MAEKRPLIVNVGTALVVGAIGVVLAFVAFSDDRSERAGVFSAWMSGSSPADTGPPDVGTSGAEATAQLALPDPSLARERRWERSRDAGPPPDGFSTNMIQHEQMFHRMFRRQMGDAIELCLDEMRRRGESFDGRLRFHVTAQPKAGFRLGYGLNGIRVASDGGPTDAGAARELPSDVYQCMWDTIEAMEVTLPVTAAPLLAVDEEPQLYIDWDVQEHGPAGEVEVFDVGFPAMEATEAMPDAAGAD